jgi:hypothetical protein
MQIMCDGKPFNPCRGLTDAQARAAFEMYAQHRPMHGYTFQLLDGKGAVVDEKVSPKGSGKK